ncbi:hypothetical protein TNCV_929641 [Trichonephila clavipes]|nr:hypothetical protein TNCV_929641 [Trichonephila clavipes]
MVTSLGTAGLLMVDNNKTLQTAETKSKRVLKENPSQTKTGKVRTEGGAPEMVEGGNNLKCLGHRGGELSSKVVKPLQWAGRACQSEHVSDTCRFEKKPGENRILRQLCSNELRIKDRLIWAHQ